MERKYQYRSPEDKDEIVEALYEETQSTKDKRYPGNNTLRDVLDQIFRILQEAKSEKSIRSYSEEFSERYSLIACGLIGTFCVFGARGMAENNTWANESLIFFGGLTFWLIFLTVSLEKLSFFRYLWSYSSVKFFVSVIFGAAAINASAESSSIINNVFGVDASVFVYTQSLLTGLLLFRIFIPLFWLVLFSCCFHILIIFNEWKEEALSVKPFIHLVVSLCISIYVLNVMSDSLSGEELEFKAYKMAHKLDFNDRIHCVDEEKIGIDIVGVYLGPSHKEYLLDHKIKTNEGLKEFFAKSHKNASTVVPDDFFIGECGSDIELPYKVNY